MNERLALIVEDDVDVAYALAENLKTFNFKIEIALSLAEAFRILRERGPEIVILDIKLPDGNGMQIVRELRRQDLLTSRETWTPVIVVSGVEAPDFSDFNHETSSISTFLSKPYSWDALSEAVEKILARKPRV